jgi:anti-sigma regulatory factor (Ser/Thr protein kinase)
MPDQLTCEGDADAASLVRLLDEIESFGCSHRWPVQVGSHVRLALEEVLINVMSYGSLGQGAPRLKIALTQDATQILITVADNGIAFAPLQVAPPDLDAALEDREAGGLGVFLVSRLMDSVSYQRKGDWNQLRMSKSLL